MAADEVRPPDWLVAGRDVVHSIFGTGTVGRVGDYEGEPTVWIDFDYGERKALALQYGLPRLAPRGRKTPRGGELGTVGRERTVADSPLVLSATESCP